VASNTASSLGGGVSEGAVTNSIVYFNNGVNVFNTKLLAYTCTTPLIGDIGVFTNAPLFVNLAGGDLHLQSNSPCINAGNNAYVIGSIDLDGNPRIVGGTVDLGAYEFQTPASVISIAWLQQYGLPTDGTADYVDTDGDGMNNWQEWVAGTNPTNAASLLKMLAPSITVSGVTVRWQSVSGKTYFIQRSGDLSVPASFTTLQGNIAGQTGTTTYLDLTATGPGPFFYRVGVQ